MYYAIQCAILFCIYFGTAALGLSFYPVSSFATLVWPATGISIAALYLYGRRLWPAIAIAAFLVNLITGAAPLIAFGIALGNTLEAVVGAHLLRQSKTFDRLIVKLRDAVDLMFVSLAVPLVSASIGVICLWAGGLVAPETILDTWVAWYMGDMLGALVYLPLLLRWVPPLLHRPLAEISELATLSLALVGICYVVFWTTLFTGISSFPAAYLLFVPLVWAALRTGSLGTTLSVVIVSIMASLSAITHSGPFSTILPQNALLALQLFMTVLVMVFLTFTSIVEEQKNSTRELEVALSKLRGTLRKISSEDKAKADFIATLAHELRNPLAPIISSLELMRMPGTSESEKPRLIGVIDTHIQVFRRLLDDLLDISRISHRKFALQNETVELQTIIEHSRETVEEFYRTRGHMLSINMPNEPIWLKADQVRLQQIIVNLLYNAGKYTPSSGNIQLTVTKERATVRIALKDNGIGMAPESLQRIFEPFTQFGTTIEHLRAGLGIGLSITKRLVDMHKGKIYAESEGLGKGSKFVVTLPIPANPQLPMPLNKKVPVAKAETAHLEVKQSSTGSKILVVDDNEAAAEGLGTLLRLVGHEVKVVFGGEEALGAAKSFMPDVILLDIGLPGMDGYEVIKRLKLLEVKALFVALTGYGQDEDKMRTKKAGFAHHLVKPVGIKELQEILG